MREIRFHGRGGQGVAMAAEILAAAFVRDGFFAAAFPLFGFERRSAPLASFLRFDAARVRERTQVYTPDCLVVLDAGLIRTSNVFQGFKNGGVVVGNGSTLPPLPADVRVGLAGVVGASAIAMEELGRPAANTAILGAFARITRWVSLGSLMEALASYFEGASLAGNRRALQRGYDETVLIGELNHSRAIP